tara:strand:- start:105014 stop:105910 length:897 start_codon:yes stop_codon:yes gene_type:complete
LANLEYLFIDNEQAKTLRNNLLNGRHQEAENFLNTLTDTNDRHYYFEAAADWNKTPAKVQEWFTSQSRPAQIASTIHRTKQAWNYSDWTYGSKDPEKFRSEINACNEQFTLLATLNPRDASFYYWRIWIARALYRADLSRELFDEALSREPGCKANASNSLFTESSWWFGSPNGLAEHARSLIPRLPAKIGAHTLLIEAHKLNSTSSPEVWLDPGVKGDIIEANDQCIREGFQGVNGQRSRHWLAWGLSKIHEYQRAAEHFEVLLGNAPAEPWGSMRFGLDRIFSSYKSAKKKSIGAK